MAPNTIKTLVLTSALVLLGSLSDSVDARNQSAAVTHYHKLHEKTAKCKKCVTTVDLSKFYVLCYHKFDGHVNWFYKIPEKKEPGSECNCCDEPVKYTQEKVENWHLIYPTDVTWCYTPYSKQYAKDLYDVDLKLQCDWA